jgi:CheY-like chemotaxis protein
LNNKATEESCTPLSLDARCEARIGVAAEAGTVTTTAAPFALIIDDQEAVCRIVASALAELGVEFAAYGTAKPAIASLEHRRPEVIFLDVALEQSDAIDVIKGLSEKRYTGIVQLMSGGRPALLEAVQRIGVRYGLAVRPPLQKPFGDLREVIVGLGLARSP